MMKTYNLVLFEEGLEVIHNALDIAENRYLELMLEAEKECMKDLTRTTAAKYNRLKEKHDAFAYVKQLVHNTFIKGGITCE